MGGMQQRHPSFVRRQEKQHPQLTVWVTLMERKSQVISHPPPTPTGEDLPFTFSDPEEPLEGEEICSNSRSPQVSDKQETNAEGSM